MKLLGKLLILFLAAAAGGCSSSAVSQPEKRLEQTAMQIIKLSPGQTFTLELEGNPSTGYGWQVINAAPEIVEVKYINYKSSSDKPHFVGAPGKFFWQIKGLKAGEAQIEFQYYRHWEKFDPARDKVRQIRISVQ